MKLLKSFILPLDKPPARALVKLTAEKPVDALLLDRFARLLQAGDAAVILTLLIELHDQHRALEAA